MRKRPELRNTMGKTCFSLLGVSKGSMHYTVIYGSSNWLIATNISLLFLLFLLFFFSDKSFSSVIKGFDHR